jgi:hypothetical protein
MAAGETPTSDLDFGSQNSGKSLNGTVKLARTTSTQPRSTGGDQAGRAADFIDSIDPKPAQGAWGVVTLATKR